MITFKCVVNSVLNQGVRELYPQKYVEPWKNVLFSDLGLFKSLKICSICCDIRKVIQSASGALN